MIKISVDDRILLITILELVIPTLSNPDMIKRINEIIEKLKVL